MSEMLNPAVRAVALNRLSQRIQYQGSDELNRLPSIILIRNRTRPPPSTSAVVMRTTSQLYVDQWRLTVSRRSQPRATLALRTISRYMAKPRLPHSTITMMVIWPPML